MHLSTPHTWYMYSQSCIPRYQNRSNLGDALKLWTSMLCAIFCIIISYPLC